MKKYYFLAVIFFALAVSLGALDTIVLLNGTTIDAKVEGISPTLILYRRPDNLDGQMYVINKKEVRIIMYENGATEEITPEYHSALDPNKSYFSLSFEPSGFLIGGPSATAEFTKGSRIISFHASFPSLAKNSAATGFGVGLGAGINYFWSGRIGGFYLGGLFEWSRYPLSYTVYNPYAKYNPNTDSYSGMNVIEETKANKYIIALNTGYKFITKSGIFFRTGIAGGVALSSVLPKQFYYKPDIATGYIF